MTKEQKALKFAKKASIKASEKILPLFGKVKATKFKKSKTDIYSEADLLAETAISTILKTEFPRYNYLSEERGLTDNKSDYTWVVDPLDGSIPFVAGMDSWGISIGLLKGNRPVVGVINIPSQKWLVTSLVGKGTFLNGEKISVSKQNKYDQSIVGFDVGHRGKREKDLIKNVASQIDKVRYMPSLACTTFGQVLVAKGTYDAYFHHRAFVWDFCAGVLIIQEAGGKVTGHKGTSVDLTKRDNISILASNRLIHNKILSVLKSAS